MDLSKALDDLKYDVRMRDWNVKQGLVTKADLDAQVNQLKDSANDSEPVTLEDKDDFVGQ